MKYVYRIVNALFAAAVFPSAIFLEFVLIRLSTSFLEVGLEESLTLKKIIGFFTGSDTIVGFTYAEIKSPEGFVFPEALNPVKGQLIAVVVAFALALIAVIFIFVWSICSNKRIPVVIAAAAGIISIVVMNACFNSAVTPLVEGTINVLDLFTTNWLVSLLGNVVFVDKLCFAGFHNGIIICFAVILAWTAAFYLVEIGEPKEEKKAAKVKKSKK